MKLAQKKSEKYQEIMKGKENSNITSSGRSEELNHHRTSDGKSETEIKRRTSS